LRRRVIAGQKIERRGLGIGLVTEQVAARGKAFVDQPPDFASFGYAADIERVIRVIQIVRSILGDITGASV